MSYVLFVRAGAAGPLSGGVNKNSIFNEETIRQAGASRWNEGDAADGDLVRTGLYAYYDLNGPATSGDTALGHVLNGGAGRTRGAVLGVAVPVMEGSSSYRDGSLSLQQSNRAWGQIGSLEMLVASSDTGTVVGDAAIANFSDVRLKIGDVSPAADWFHRPNAPAMRMTLSNVMNGGIDGTLSDQGLAAEITVTRKAATDSRIDNQGSVFADSFTVGTGWVKGNINTGSRTQVHTNLGAGDDTYTASAKGVAEIADVVWGGSGKDTISGGAGYDVLFGDFGTYAPGGRPKAIAQPANPTPLEFTFGRNGDGYGDWNAPGLLKVWQKNLGGQRLDAAPGNWDKFLLEPGYSGSVGGIGVGSHVLGVDDNGSRPDGVNPEVNNTDVLGFDFGQTISRAEIGLGLFYAIEGEVLSLELLKGGQTVATFTIGANHQVTGDTAGFTVSMAGYPWTNAWIGDHTVTLAGIGGAVFDGMIMRSVDHTASWGDPWDFYVSDLKLVPTEEQDDVIVGGAGCDYIDGGDGNDDMSGGSGSDEMLGGAGNDRIGGGGGGDRITGGEGDDRISGNDGNDVISGDGGRDWIDGGAGDDRLRGGRGDDILKGGAGKDCFLFNRNELNDFRRDIDTIEDFQRGRDKIVITGKAALASVVVEDGWYVHEIRWEQGSSDVIRTHVKLNQKSDFSFL